MGGRSMSDSQVQRFITSMEDQGVGVTRTKKGLFLRLPDNTSTTVHFTNSDVRAFDNLIARLRRAGVRHPEDPKAVAELPSMITSGDASPASKKKIRQAMIDLDYPDVVTIMPLMKITGMEHVTIARALYHMGFKPIAGKRNSRDWLTPDDILALKPPAEPEGEDRFGVPESEQYTNPGHTIAENADPEWLAENTAPSTPHTDAALMDFVGRARAAQAAINDMGMGNPQVSRETSTSDLRVDSSGREFIDTHDSWVVDLTRLPLNVTIGEYLQSLDASGLEFEVRVWRRA